MAHRLASLKAGGLEDHSKGAITHNPLCGVVDSRAANATGGRCRDDMPTYTGVPLYHTSLVHLHTRHSMTLVTVRQQAVQLRQLLGERIICN